MFIILFCAKLHLTQSSWQERTHHPLTELVLQRRGKMVEKRVEMVKGEWTADENRVERGRKESGEGMKKSGEG